MYKNIAFFTFSSLSFFFLWLVPIVPLLRRAAMACFKPDSHDDNAIYDLLKIIDGQFEWDDLFPAIILYLLISIGVFAFAFVAALIWPILIFCIPPMIAMIVSKLRRGKKAE